MSRLDELIEKLCPDGVEMHELQELFTTRNGYTPSKSKSEFWENGTVPWFKMEDIRANGNILSDALQHVNECAVKGQLFPENSIIVATFGNCWRTCTYNSSITCKSEIYLSNG